jgi:cob(I)alamin adenosyltransferase
VAKAQAAWEVAQCYLRDAGTALVLLDEVNVALRHSYLDVQQVLADLRARPPLQHVVLTGRHAPAELIDAADTVSDVRLVKHAFRQGIRAQKGIEW